MTEESHNQNTASSEDVASIVPERALQQIADDYNYVADALRSAVREDLQRNQRLADHILDRRPVVHEGDKYVVVRAPDGVTDETRLPVLGVYERMDGSNTDYTSGYALVVPTTDTNDECPYEVELENTADRRGDDR